MLASYIPIHLLSLDYIAIYADSRASLHNLGPLCVRAGGFGHPHVPGGPLRRAGAARAGPSGRPEEVQGRHRRTGAGEGRLGAHRATFEKEGLADAHFNHISRLGSLRKMC